MGRFKTTLQEDLEQLGISSNVIIGNIRATPSGELDEPEPEPEQEEQQEEQKVDEDSDDPIDGLYVTKELFDRIEALPFDAMEESDFEELLNELSEKKLPDGDDELREHAERVVVLLKEGAATRQRRFKAKSTARKMSFQCPKGQRAVSVGSGGGRPQCRPAHIVSGGMGKLRKESRKKKKWSRGGKGTMSKMRSFRAEKRRGAMRREDLISPFAQDLMQVAEGVHGNDNVSVRDDIVEHCVNIVELLNEEFVDQVVTQIYEDAVENMLDAYDVGRLDEDVMDGSEFIAELEPITSLITKSLENLEKTEDLGNE
jgi:hypothetical protein